MGRYSRIGGGGGGGGGMGGSPRGWRGSGGGGGGGGGGFTDREAEDLFRSMFGGSGGPWGGARVQREIYSSPAGMRVRTTTVDADGRVHVKEEALRPEDSPFGTARDQQQANEAARAMLKEVAGHALKAVGAALADAVRRKARSFVGRLFDKRKS